MSCRQFQISETGPGDELLELNDELIDELELSELSDDRLLLIEEDDEIELRDDKLDEIDELELSELNDDRLDEIDELELIEDELLTKL